MIQITVFIIIEILLYLNLLREVFVIRDIKSNFYCGNCNTFNEEISNIGNCSNCHRKFKIKGNQWDHLILHRVNWIPTKSKSEVFKWKDYRKLSIIEITINIIFILIMAVAILITYFS